MSASSSSARDLLPGVHGCSGKCDCCSYMKKNNKFQSRSGKVYRIRQSLNCKTPSVIYIIECKRCCVQFVEKSTDALKTTFSKLKKSIRKKEFCPLSNHFNNNGHLFSDINIFPIEQVTDLKKLGERELYWIKELKILDQKANMTFVYGESVVMGRPQARDLDEDKNSTHSVINLVDDDPEEGTSCHSKTQSAAVTSKRKRLGVNPKPPRKNRKMDNKKLCVFVPEAEKRFHACKDAILEARHVMKEIMKKLEHVSCQKSESNEFLRKLREETMKLQEMQMFEKIYIGLFGRTGAGKSSLINAIVNQDIVPRGSGKACTSVCVQVEANTENNKYRAEIEFISKEDWEFELRYLLEVLSSDTLGKGDDIGDEDKKIRKAAKEKIEALYGEAGLNTNGQQLLGDKEIAKIMCKPKKTFLYSSAKHLYKGISCYIQSSRRKMEKAYWPLVKCVTIYIPGCPFLPKGVVLVDLPGAGDANKQRDEMWKECINKCASVWIVNDIDRALSDKEGDSIFESSLRTIGGGGLCHNITFVCTKSDMINTKMIKLNYDITDQDLAINHMQGSENYERMEKQACILYRNEYVKEEITNDSKKEVEAMLLGEHDDSDSFFNVFTVSSDEYEHILHGQTSTLKPEQTEIPLLMEHIKNLYVSDYEKKVKKYLTQVSGVISFLHLSKTTLSIKLQHFCSAEFSRLEKNLRTQCDTIETFISDFERKLHTALDEGVQEAERRCLVNARKILKPAGKDNRGYHRTLKAMCRNNGYYRSINGDVVDLNYTVSQPMYAKINGNSMFVKTFSPKNLRNSVNGKLESFQENFTSFLDGYKKESEKYMRLVYIKTQQWKLLSDVEQEILQRKRCIYNSVSDIIQETLQPVYTEFGGPETYTLKDIQEKLHKRIASCQNQMFREARKEMLRLLQDLKTWIVKEIETQMITAMRVALQQTPDDFINLPGVHKEYEVIKKSCESLDIDIF